MKKYMIVWALLFFVTLYLLSSPDSLLHQFAALGPTENIMYFGIALIFSTQIVVFFWLYRQIKALQGKKAPPQDESPEA